MKRLIVNADDFGLCSCVNRGIEHAFRNGILTSTTLMANMPGFEEATTIAKRNPTLGVGVHLNLIRGFPLLDPSVVSPLLADDGRFLPTLKSIRSACRSAEYLAAAVCEYRAQIEHVLGAGIQPTHLDFEKHHALPLPLRCVVSQLAKEYGLAMRNLCEPVGFVVTRLPWAGWRALYNMYMLRLILELYPLRDPPRMPDYFFGQSHICRIDQAYLKALCKHLPDGDSELMVHPGYYDEEEFSRLWGQMGPSYAHALRPAELAALTAQDIQKLPQACGIELINFQALL